MKVPSILGRKTVAFIFTRARFHPDTGDMAMAHHNPRAGNKLKKFGLIRERSPSLSLPDAHQELSRHQQQRSTEANEHLREIPFSPHVCRRAIKLKEVSAGAAPKFVLRAPQLTGLRSTADQHRQSKTPPKLRC